MKRRVLTIGLAVLLAVVGTVAVLAYVKQADTRAVAGMRAVTVLVADKKVPAGTTGSAAYDSGLVRIERLPAQSVPSDALGQIDSSVADLVATADIQPGQLVLRSMFGQRRTATAGGLPIPAGDIAVTVQFCVAEAVAGYVKPGAEVAVFDTVTANTGTDFADNAACAGPHAEHMTDRASTQLVLPKVPVLAVGAAPAGSGQSTTTASSGGSAQSSTMLITLAADQQDAERLILLSQTGLPYLALVTDDSDVNTDAPAALFQLPK